jgi:ferric-dicitrate binding protein FerR (iron transport regulator)
MEHTEEEITYAFRLLNERETLDDCEVEEWMKSAAHRRLMNDMEAARQQWEAGKGDEMERAVLAAEEARGRRKTLRRALVVAALLAALLAVRTVVAW